MKKSELRQIIREVVAEAVGYNRADAAYTEIKKYFSEHSAAKRAWDRLTNNKKIVFLTKFPRYKLTMAEAEQLAKKLSGYKEGSVREAGPSLANRGFADMWRKIRKDDKAINQLAQRRPTEQIQWLKTNYDLSIDDAKKMRGHLNAYISNAKNKIPLESIREDRIRKLSAWPKRVGTGDGTSSYVYMLDNGYELVITKGGKEAFTAKYGYLKTAKAIEDRFKQLGFEKFAKQFKQHNGADERDIPKGPPPKYPRHRR